MTDALIEAVARAIRDELFDGTENKPPVGAETPAHGMARAAIAAIEASGTHRVVPVEARVSQGAAGEDALRAVCPQVAHPQNMQAVSAIYAAMLTAAPKVGE